MKNENQKKPEYSQGEQVWHIEPHECGIGFGDPCPLIPPRLLSGRFVDVMQRGRYYCLSNGHAVRPDDAYPTPEAASSAIPDVLRAKIKHLRDRLAELETMLDKSEVTEDGGERKK